MSSQMGERAIRRSVYWSDSGLHPGRYPPLSPNHVEIGIVLGTDVLSVFHRRNKRSGGARLGGSSASMVARTVPSSLLQPLRYALGPE